MGGMGGGVCSSDRIIMWIFAILDLAALVAAIILGAQTINQTHHASNLPSLTTSGVDVKVRYEMAIGWAIGLTCFSLGALLAVSAYYTVGRVLMWTGSRSDMVQHAHTMQTTKQMHMEVPLATTEGNDGRCRILGKMINIAIGALGLVTITAASVFFGAAAWLADCMVFTTTAEKTIAKDNLNMASSAAVLALVFKLLQALLGHLWAVLLSNHRDKFQTMRDHSLGLMHEKPLAEEAAAQSPTYMAPMVYT